MCSSPAKDGNAMYSRPLVACLRSSSSPAPKFRVFVG
jgi:hypothetical protein